MHTKTYTANYHDAFQKKNMENQKNMEPNTTRKTLLEHGVFWPNIYTNFVIDFVKPGNENSLPYSLFGLIEECTEFVQLIEKPDNSEELLLEAGDILYYAVLTSKNLRKNDPDTDPWPNFFLIDDSSKEKGIEFNEYAKNQMLLDIQKFPTNTQQGITPYKRKLQYKTSRCKHFAVNILSEKQVGKRPTVFVLYLLCFSDKNNPPFSKFSNSYK